MNILEAFDYWVIFNDDKEFVHFVGYETLPSNQELTDLYDELYEEFGEDLVNSWDSDIVSIDELPSKALDMLQGIEYTEQEEHTVDNVTIH